MPKPAPSPQSPVPANAIPIWHNGDSLFACYPGPSGPIICRYPLTQTGLLSALGIIRAKALDAFDRTAAINSLAATTIASRPRPQVPLEQSLHAQGILRKLGIGRR